ncbi:MAG: hypothetical protein CMQ34_09900 [Gammaproteobacteria bacterium]|nr:hypothetical protein [Gammaproteobacteria bacterium]|tara:strand:+ start:912 stop:1193 length:282 start_codon:yes stop_codon:yes gene_type:complete
MTQPQKHEHETTQTDTGDHQEAEQRTQDNRKRGSLSFWQTLVSVGQASFGVQNQKNKERDFEQGSIKGFVAAALIFTVVFVLALVVIVSVVLG